MTLSILPLWFWLVLAAVGVGFIVWLAWSCARMSGMAQRDQQPSGAALVEDMARRISR